MANICLSRTFHTQLIRIERFTYFPFQDDIFILHGFPPLIHFSRLSPLSLDLTAELWSTLPVPSLSPFLRWTGPLFPQFSLNAFNPLLSHPQCDSIRIARKYSRLLRFLSQTDFDSFWVCSLVACAVHLNGVFAQCQRKRAVYLSRRFIHL